MTTVNSIEDLNAQLPQLLAQARLRGTEFESARRIAALRASPEGREGVTAFLEKRAARWVAEAKR